MSDGPFNPVRRVALKLAPDEIDLLVSGAQEFLQPERLAEVDPIEDEEDENGTD